MMYVSYDIHVVRLLQLLVRVLPDLQHGGGPRGERDAVPAALLHHALRPHHDDARQGQGAVRHPGSDICSACPQS